VSPRRKSLSRALACFLCGWKFPLRIEVLSRQLDADAVLRIQCPGCDAKHLVDHDTYIRKEET
jgi:hypothetical protein